MKAINITSIIACMLICSTSYSGETQKNDKTDITNEILKRVDATGQWVAGSLDELAERLGTTVSYLWPTFVKRVVANGIKCVATGTFLCVLGTILFIVLRKIAKFNIAHAKEIRQKSYELDPIFNAAIATSFGWFIFITLIIAGWVVASNGITDILAPEPEALKQIVDAVRALK